LSDTAVTTAASSSQGAVGLAEGASMHDVLMDQLGAVLRTPRELLAADKPFRSLGLDSLMGLELRNRLERILGMKLSASTVWNFPTANQLSAHLAERLQALVSPAAAVPPARSAESEEDAAAQALEAELRAADELLADL
jgi:acyl carrier protein